MIRRVLRPWWVRCILLPFLALVAAHAGLTLVLKWEFERRIAELRASGAPVEFLDLAPPPVPDEDNAAPLLAEAQRWYEENLREEPPALVHLLEGSLEAYYGGEEPDPLAEPTDERIELKEWLAKGDPYVDLLARAAEKPALRQDLDWAAGWAMAVPTLRQMSHALRYLTGRARIAERATADEIRELAIVLDLAPKLERHTLIPVAVGWVLSCEAEKALHVLSGRPGFDAREARSLLDRRLASVDDTSALREALRGDRVTGLDFSRRWIAGESPGALMREAAALSDRWVADDPTFVDHLLASWIARPLAYRDALRLLDLMEKELRLLDLPPREALAGAEALRDEYGRGLPNVASRLLAGLPASMFRDRLRLRARMRIARVGLALLELRQTTGAWPETLDALVPLTGEEWIEDPFTGERLRYEPGVRLEAAAPIPFEEMRADYEIVWRFGR